MCVHVYTGLWFTCAFTCTYMYVQLTCTLYMYLDILSLKVGDLRSETPCGIHGTNHTLSLLQDCETKTHAEVVFSKPWCLVYHPSTALCRHIRITAEYIHTV